MAVVASLVGLSYVLFLGELDLLASFSLLLSLSCILLNYFKKVSYIVCNYDAILNYAYLSSSISYLDARCSDDGSVITIFLVLAFYFLVGLIDLSVFLFLVGNVFFNIFSTSASSN